MTCPSTLPDLAHHPDALRVIKRPADLAVQFASSDGTCDTLEGPVRYQSGDALITGTQGERWPVARARFDRTYERVSDGVYRKRRIMAYALRVNEPLTVQVGAQCDPLSANAGDWLLQYDQDEYGVVDPHVFEQTYEVVS
jgi:hypothetical protein